MTRQRVVLRRGGHSVRLDVRPLAVTSALGAAALLAVAVSVSVGEFGLPLADVLAALVGAGDQATHFIVFDLRLPRAVCGLLVGAALGIAGAIFQDVTRNPLVSPDIVGISGGAAVAGVAVIVFTSAGNSAVSVPLAALGGAFASGVLLYALAWRGGVQGNRLVLAGIGLAACAQAGVGYVLTEGRIFEVARAYVWMVGSLNGRGWDQAWPLAVALAVLLPLLLALGRRGDMLRFGDDLASALGVGAERTRLALLAGAVTLTAFAVACAGPILFVAFLAPHIGRWVARAASTQSALLAAAACGALIVLVSDLVGRMLFTPTEIPVGLITSIIAAPYFLLLLRRATSVGAAG